MSDMQCPYCGADQEVCHDDGNGYAEGVKHEHECSECEKTFVFETFISFDYEPSKADCLNGPSMSWRSEKAGRRSIRGCVASTVATNERLQRKRLLLVSIILRCIGQRSDALGN